MERLEREHGVSVEWRAFELRPMGVPVPPKPEGYLRRAWEGVHQLNRQFGMPLMQRNSHQGMPSRYALEGQKFAAEHGQVDAYTTAVFHAVFYDDRDIADLDVLTELASQVGLDRKAFLNAVGQRRYREAVEADLAQAQLWGITAVPCFVSGRRGAMGVQTYEDLVELVLGSDPTAADGD